MRIYLIFLAGLLSLHFVSAQESHRTLREASPTSSPPPSTAFFVIDQIQIIGNHKTKKQIILRELDVKEGDTLYAQEIDTILSRNRNKIFNTNLFVSVEMSLIKSATRTTRLNIQLEERWYIFPGPIFELSDRNFSEWWNTYNADFSRVNYGMRFVVENFRGRSEKVDLLLQFGFERKISLDYTIPYIDKKQKTGIELGISYANNNSVAFRSLDHQLDFIDSTRSLRTRVRAKFGISRRNAFYNFHKVELLYERNKVADTVLVLNPDYLFGQDNTQEFLRFRYIFTKDKRDIQAYPLQGDFLRLMFEKRGLGIFNDVNLTSLTGTYGYYYKLKPKLFVDHTVIGRLNYQNRQPYVESRALGYGDNTIRGFDLYVIDGQSFLLNRNTLKFRLFEFDKTLNFIPIRQFRRFPVAAYLTAYYDHAIVQDQFFRENSQRFSNQYIYGWGVGLDVFTAYNLLLQLNYSFNSDLESGFFFSFKSSL